MAKAKQVRKGRVISGEIPAELYKLVARDATIEKRSVIKQVEFVLEKHYGDK